MISILYFAGQKDDDNSKARGGGSSFGKSFGGGPNSKSDDTFGMRGDNHGRNDGSAGRGAFG